MTPLPAGYTLCRPADPGPRCHNCRRWANHPEQVIGHITRIVNAAGPRDKACIYIPISRLEDTK